MAAVTTMRVKVPSKQSLEFLLSHWDRNRDPVLRGEIEPPPIGREMELNTAKQSHVITNIRTETFDPKTNSVAADVVFCGPRSAEAIDAYLNGALRLFPRAVRVRPPGGTSKDAFDSIITWDAVQKPDLEPLSPTFEKVKAQIRREANEKDRRIEMAKKKRR